MLAFFPQRNGLRRQQWPDRFQDILGFNLQDDTTRIALLHATALMFAVGYRLPAIVASRLGRVVAIRDAEDRTLSVTVWRRRFCNFTFSAVLAGIAGVSMCPRWALSILRILPAELHRSSLGGCRRPRNPYTAQRLGQSWSTTARATSQLRCRRYGCLHRRPVRAGHLFLPKRRYRPAQAKEGRVVNSLQNLREVMRRDRVFDLCCKPPGSKST